MKTKVDLKSILMTVAIAFIGGIAALSINSLFNDKKQTEQQIIAVNNPIGQFTSGNTMPENTVDFTVAAQKAIDAVVHVKTQYFTDLNNPLYQLFFGQGAEIPPMEGTGSGVIISPSGYIVTNNHVIDKSADIEVILNDKRSFKAKLIGTDPATDIALLKIEGENLPTLADGDSDSLKIGEWVLAIGNPFNLTSTVTAGIISAKSRNINILNKSFAIESFIQTDAAVNPGNSGGALVDTKGRLIGINTAIASKTGSFAGYSFAVPVNIVKKVVADLIEYGRVQRALLGVSIKEVDAELAKKMKLEKIAGIHVSAVAENGAAKDAGIQIDDIIIKVETKIVNKVSELQEQINKYRPGDKVKITILRSSKEKELTVTLRNQEGGTNFINRDAIEILGAYFSPITDDEKASLGLKFGVKVVELQAGKFLRAGIQKGFIVTHINNQSIRTVDDVQKIINTAKGGVMVEGIYPDGTAGYYAFGLR